MMLTDRDRRIIQAVAEFGILTRSQIAFYLSFGSVTRANAILLRLTRHGYLSRRLQATVRGSRRQAYVLGRTGAELLDGSSQVARQRRSVWQQHSDLFVEHELHLNDVHLAFCGAHHDGYRLITWKPPKDLREQGLGLIPDGYVEYALGDQTFAAFVEADMGTESRTRWRTKVEAYTRLAFSGRFTDMLGRRFFRVLVVTTSERRLSGIAAEIAKQTDRIFWLTTFEQLRSHGPFAPIWRRPKDQALQSLIPQSL